MGAAAFLMAEFLNIPYGQIAFAAAIPAALYYLALFTQIDLEAAKRGLLGLPADQIPKVSQRHPLGLGISDSAFDSRLHPDDRKLGSRQSRHGRRHRRLCRRRNCKKKPDRRSRKSLRLSKRPAKSLLDIAVITALAGIVIGALHLSGFTFKISLLARHAFRQ